MTARPVLLAAAVGAPATAYAASYAWGRAGGSTAAERASPRPGDDLVHCPQLVTDHAVTIDASPAEVWPWLTQMGWHRAGYYTPGWVDRALFPANRPSADRLDPGLVRDLRVGDTIPDGPPGTAEFVVAQADAPHVLVLRSTTHLPPGWADHGARLTWTWCLLLTELRGGGTRLHLRVRGRTTPWWLTAAYVGALVPADGVMGTGMLRGIKRRVESTATTASAD